MFSRTIARVGLFLAVGLPTAGVLAREIRVETPSKATETLVSIARVTKDHCIVIEVEETAKLNVGDRFEVVIALPGDGGTAIVANGHLTSVTGDVVIGKIEAHSGKVTADHKVRFLPAEQRASPVQTTAAKPKEDRPVRSFHDALTTYRRSVMLAKDNEGKRFGTAFVISKKHRLLATNAHIADFAEAAVLNESRAAYKVVGRWYHPNTIRTIRYDNQTLMVSSNPALGAVYARGVDIAILQLEMAGPDLPTEMELASPAECRDLVGSDSGMFGFPGYGVRDPGDFVRATFVQGVISRTDLPAGFLRREQTAANLRSIYFTAPPYPGFSGSPVFLANGKVVAIFNAILKPSEGGQISHAARVDSLWDMLRHFNLLDKMSEVPELDVPMLLTEANQNPAAIALLKAVDIALEGDKLRQKGEFVEAVKKLNEAAKLAPEWWEVYSFLGKTVDSFVQSAFTNLSDQQKTDFYKSAFNYYMKSDEVAYKTLGFHRVDTLLEIARLGINLSRFGGDKEALKMVVNMMSAENLQKAALGGPDAAFYLALRAAVKRDLNLLEGALADINEAIRRDSRNDDYVKERRRIREQLAAIAGTAPSESPELAGR